jgi:hypothetical protein
MLDEISGMGKTNRNASDTQKCIVVVITHLPEIKHSIHVTEYLFLYFQTHCCLAETKRCVHEDDFQKLTAFIECEQPIPDLYSFVGNLNIVRDNGERIVKPLGPENVLLRGARLKNTPFIYGKKSF